MGTLIGFAFGYVLGAKAGPESLAEMRRAWQAIQESEEFQALAASAQVFLQDLLARGGSLLAGELGKLQNGNGGDLGETLRHLSGNGDLGQAWSRIQESPEVQRLLAEGMAALTGVLAQGRAKAAETQSFAGRA